jgi:hypothetical protein
MSRTIANDSVESRSEMRKRLAKNFNKFIVDYSVHNESYKGKTLYLFEERDFTVSLIEHFIAYLEDNIKCFQTARVYLSSLYVFLREKYLSWYNNSVAANSTEWQNKLRKHYSKQCHINRTAMVTHKMPINAADNHYICKKLFEKNLFEEGALQALDWSNGGRISEGPGLEWRDFELFESIVLHSQVSCMRVYWFRGKTRSLTATYNFVHAVSWEACVFHALARYIILKRNTSELVFPALAATNVKTRMNGLLKDIYQAWKIQDERDQVQREVDEEAGMIVDDCPFVMTEGITTHGSRAGLIQTVRCAGVQDEAITKHAGGCLHVHA